MEAEGWYLDPFGVHDQRWMSAGIPTDLVRDGDQEYRDLPPSTRVDPATLERGPSSETPAPASAMTAPGLDGTFRFQPSRRSGHEMLLRVVGYYIAPPLVVGSAVLIVGFLVEPGRALFAAGVAALATLVLGARLATASNRGRRAREFDNTDWSGDLYPR